MSVYSGFATRHQEDVYNKLLAKAICLMSEKLSFYKDIFGISYFYNTK